MSQEIEKLREEIAKIYGFKPDKDDPLLAVHTILAFSALSLHELYEEAQRDAEQAKQEFLIKWEAHSKELAKKALTASLKSSHEVIEKSANKFESRLKETGDLIVQNIKKAQTPSQKEWQLFGIKKTDLIIPIFTLLFLILALNIYNLR